MELAPSIPIAFLSYLDLTLVCYNFSWKKMFAFGGIKSEYQDMEYGFLILLCMSLY